MSIINEKDVIVMVKKIVRMGIVIIIAVTLGACTNGDLPTKESKDSLVEKKVEPVSETSDVEIGESGSDDTDILIAYFSWSGNTKQLAGMIQEQVGGELFEIEPETPYTDDINELSGISLQEQRDNIRPALISVLEDISQYEVIFIGYPNWWNNMPMPVFTFLEEYDFSGKTVIPFTTYGNGVWGRSVNSIQEMLPGSVILDGLAIQEHELQNAPSKVSEWLKELGMI